MKRASCRHCGYTNDAVTSADGQTFEPTAGAVSICYGCSAIGIFTGNGIETREPTGAERAAIMADASVIDALRKLAIYRSTVAAARTFKAGLT